MKKLIKKVSEKPVLSMILVLLISAVLTSVIIFSTNLKNSFTANGIYAVKGLHSIPLHGDAELPLFEKTIDSLKNIPSNKTLVIYAGYGRFIPGTELDDLIDYNGLNRGNFYTVSINFAQHKNGVFYYEGRGGKKYSFANLESLTLPARVKLASEAVGAVNEENN